MNIASTLQTTIRNGAKKTVGAALLGATLMIAPGLQTAAHARVFFSIGIAPPAIPVYEQPLCPGDGYIWTPGYWAWTDSDAGYQWVDGAWVVAPYSGALWTPGYWGYNSGAYLWNAGYWGREVGYYGGINYGFGYFGTGFYGGYWGGDRFFYNRAYNRIDERREHNIYERREHGFDGHPGGEAFDRHGDHNDFHGERGSFVGHEGDRSNRDGFHDDHREAFGGNRPNGGNFDQGRNQHDDQQQRGFTGQNNNRQPYNGNQYQQPNNGNRQGYQGGQNERATPPQQSYNQLRPTPAQTYPGNQTYQGNQTNPGYNNPGANRGAYNNQQQYRPAPEQNFGNRGGFQGNAIRSNNTPAMVPNNGGGRSFSSPQPSAPAQQQGGNRGSAPTNNQGGGSHGGEQHGGGEGHFNRR